MLENAKNILLASHGTVGAQAAEQAAFNICRKNAHITHLIVIPKFWKDILGDDWLNNDCTRNKFCNYLEAELEDEVNLNISRVRKHLKSLGIAYTKKIIVGEPDKSLIQACEEVSYDIVVMGSPRPKGIAGLYSRMSTTFLAQNLNTSIFTAPHPNA